MCEYLMNKSIKKNRYIKAKHLSTELDKVRWLHNFRGKINLLMPGSLDFIALHFCLVIIKQVMPFICINSQCIDTAFAVFVFCYETKNRLSSYFSGTVQKNLCRKILQLKLYISVNLSTRCSYHGLLSCTCIYNNWLFLSIPHTSQIK